jgi:hypothetical protein
VTDPLFNLFNQHLEVTVAVLDDLETLETLESSGLLKDEGLRIRLAEAKAKQARDERDLEALKRAVATFRRGTQRIVTCNSEPNDGDVAIVLAGRGDRAAPLGGGILTRAKIPGGELVVFTAPDAPLSFIPKVEFEKIRSAIGVEVLALDVDHPNFQHDPIKAFERAGSKFPVEIVTWVVKALTDPFLLGLWSKCEGKAGALARARRQALVTAGRLEEATSTSEEPALSNPRDVTPGGVTSIAPPPQPAPTDAPSPEAA